MSETPEGISVARNLELRSFGFKRPARYAVLVVLAAFLLIGLLNGFGQRPAGTTVDSKTASLELYAPSRVRGGLFWEARFTIRAHEDMKRAILMLSPGWQEGLQMNTVEPVPFGQSSRDGDLLFTLGHIAAGHTYRLFVQFQVNATNVAWHRRADVALYDGGARVLGIRHTVTVFP